MLRRPATTLGITAEDLASYEDRRAREAMLAARREREHGGARRAPDSDMGSAGAPDGRGELMEARGPQQGGPQGRAQMALTQTPTPDVGGGSRARTREERIVGGGEGQERRGR